MRDSQNAEIARAAVDLGVVGAGQAARALAVVRFLRVSGVPAAVDEVLFEAGWASAADVRRLQGLLRLRSVPCPTCRRPANQWERSPGDWVRCDHCQCRLQVPGADPDDPFRPAPAPAPAPTQPSPRRRARSNSARLRATLDAIAGALL